MQLKHTAWKKPHIKITQKHENKQPQTKTCWILLSYLQPFLIIRAKELKVLVDLHTFSPILSDIEFCKYTDSLAVDWMFRSSRVYQCYALLPYRVLVHQSSWGSVWVFSKCRFFLSLASQPSQWEWDSWSCKLPRNKETENRNVTVNISRKHSVYTLFVSFSGRTKKTEEKSLLVRRSASQQTLNWFMIWC